MGFQVPRVTINIDFKEGTSFGELSIISLGYGLHQAWIYSSMFDKGGIFGTGGLQTGPFNDQLSLAYFVSILVYGLLLLIASILDTRLVRFLHATPTLVVSALLGAAGTLLLLVPGGSFLDAEVLQLASGVLTGAGSSALLLAWGIAFSRRDSASIIINGALSIAIGFSVYGLVLHQIPFPWGGAASALIPFAEVALLLVLRRHVSLDFDNRQLIFQPLPINHARFVLRFGLPVFFLGVALGIMRQTSIETILPGSAFDDQALLFVTACAATALIMVTLLALGGDERWHTFFRPLIPFIAVTAVFIPFTAGGASFWGTSVVLVGYMSFEALMWIFFAELSQRFRLSPIFVFGLGRGTMALAALGGSTLPLFTGALGTPTGLGEMGTVLMVLVTMMVAYALLPDEREMASIVTVDPKVAAAVQSLPRTPLIVVNENRPDSTRAEDSASDTQPVASEEPADEHDEDEGVDEKPATLEPSPARQAMDFSRSIFADEAGAMPPAEDTPAARGRFRQRCEIVANTYLLSRRESEVMYYLARGYKSSHIQQQLYISEGTAKTHIRHIYRKLNIHSQQDLIHLIDGVEL